MHGGEGGCSRGGSGIHGSVGHSLSFDDGTRKGGGAHLRDGLQLRIPEERPRDGLGVAAAVHGLQAGAGSGV